MREWTSQAFLRLWNLFLVWFSIWPENVLNLTGGVVDISRLDLEGLSTTRPRGANLLGIEKTVCERQQPHSICFFFRSPSRLP